ncbi:MAG: hypothetical protein V4714_20890 [Bacteroidota bacterium]
MLTLQILVLSIVAQLFLPWWMIALIPFGLAFWQASASGKAFISGFVGIALGWLGMSLLIHLRTGGILTARVAGIFSLPNSMLLILATVLIGGLVGGLAALSGYYCRKVV